MKRVWKSVLYIGEIALLVLAVLWFGGVVTTFGPDATKTGTNIVLHVNKGDTYSLSGVENLPALEEIVPRNNWLSKILVRQGFGSGKYQEDMFTLSPLVITKPYIVYFRSSSPITVNYYTKRTIMFMILFTLPAFLYFFAGVWMDGVRHHLKI